MISKSLVIKALLQRQHLLAVKRQRSFYFILSGHDFSLKNSIRYCSGQRSQTHYDILELPKDCTTQEIRTAFVQLSKKYHPDVKGATSKPNENAQFIRLSEAYHVLSKPSLRNAYDQDLLMHNFRPRTAATGTSGMNTTEVHRPWEVRPDFDPNANPNAYYGVKGMGKISNSSIVSALIIWTVFGAIFGFAMVRYSFTFNRKQVDEKSAQASNYHASVRADAEKYGNKEQLRRIVDRIN